MTVTLWPKHLNPGIVTGGIASVNTDQNGAFTIGGLEPGDYSVAAFEEINSGLATFPDFLAAIASQATDVKLDEGQQAGIDVKIIPVDRIAAEVVKLP